MQGANSKAGQSVAADVSFYFVKPEIELGSSKEGTFAFGVYVSNVGAKMSYTETSNKDFIPTNLRIGPSFKMELDQYNSIAFNLDVNKLLVPTPPVYGTKIDPVTNEREVISGRNPNVGVASGIFGSFNDAPGVVTMNADSTYSVLPGSQWREELGEVNIAGGFEYWYARQFAFRTGYFWEHYTKGNRKYFTLGAGVRYSKFGLDMSYLIANSLSNLRTITDRQQRETEAEPYSEYSVTYKKTYNRKNQELIADVRYLTYWERSDQTYTQNSRFADGTPNANGSLLQITER